jgi:hypothetical protein
MAKSPENIIRTHSKCQVQLIISEYKGLKEIVGWIKSWITFEFKLRYDYVGHKHLAEGFLQSAPYGISSYLKTVFSYYVFINEGIEAYLKYTGVGISGLSGITVYPLGEEIKTNANCSFTLIGGMPGYQAAVCAKEGGVSVEHVQSDALYAI